LLGALRTSDAVLVRSLDRLFLDAQDALKVIQEFVDKNVQLFAIDLQMDIVTLVTIRILEAIRAAEVERHSARIRSGKMRKPFDSLIFGGKPSFGFEVVAGRLVENAKEQSLIKRAIRLRSASKPMSYRSIAARLSSRGDVYVSHVTVRRILLDRGYD
jgi:putative DNA-invertase from lambdoid prophage Rac